MVIIRESMYPVKCDKCGSPLTRLFMIGYSWVSQVTVCPDDHYVWKLEEYQQKIKGM